MSAGVQKHQEPTQAYNQENQPKRNNASIPNAQGKDKTVPVRKDEPASNERSGGMKGEGDTGSRTPEDRNAYNDHN